MTRIPNRLEYLITPKKVERKVVEVNIPRVRFTRYGHADIGDIVGGLFMILFWLSVATAVGLFFLWGGMRTYYKAFDRSVPQPKTAQELLQENKETFAYNCSYELDGTANVGSDNYKDWTCQTK